MLIYEKYNLFVDMYNLIITNNIDSKKSLIDKYGLKETIECINAFNAVPRSISKYITFNYVVHNNKHLYTLNKRMSSICNKIKSKGINEFICEIPLICIELRASLDPIHRITAAIDDFVTDEIVKFNFYFLDNTNYKPIADSLMALFYIDSKQTLKTLLEESIKSVDNFCYLFINKGEEVNYTKTARQLQKSIQQNVTTVINKLKEVQRIYTFELLPMFDSNKCYQATLVDHCYEIGRLP